MMHKGCLCSLWEMNDPACQFVKEIKIFHIQVKWKSGIIHLPDFSFCFDLEQQIFWHPLSPLSRVFFSRFGQVFFWKGSLGWNHIFFELYLFPPCADPCVWKHLCSTIFNSNSKSCNFVISSSSLKLLREGHLMNWQSWITLNKHQSIY